MKIYSYILKRKKLEKLKKTSQLFEVMLVLKIIFFIVLIKCAYSDDPLLVSTSLGKVTGHYKTTRANIRYKAYEGVPFAQPPVGEKRFLVSFDH